MLNRIDIHISASKFRVPALETERSGVDFEKLSDNRRGEASDDIRARVEQARQCQRERFAGLNNGVMTNADMRVAEVRQFCELDVEGQTLIKAAMTQLQLSARAYHRILKLARTIADLAGKRIFNPIHAYGWSIVISFRGYEGVDANRSVLSCVNI